MGTTLRKSGYRILDFDIVKGKGCYIYDETGNKYLDFESGVWCCALGHSNEEINAIIKKQIDKITHTGYTFTNSFSNTASDIILDIHNMQDGKCSFLSSGTEAVELAVQIGREITKNKLMLVLVDQYFGSYGSAKKKDPKEFYIFNFDACTFCEKNHDCDASCPQFKKIPFDDIASFIFEPGGKGGLAKFPPNGIVKKIEEVIKQRCGYIIVNEVTTGLGRTGKWFGYQHYDIIPDIVAMGKILGNGYPVSAVALNSKVSEELDRIEFHYSQSHSNDPLGCTIAGAVIATLKKEKLIERSNKIGKFFLDEFKKLVEDHHEIREVRGRGMTICIEFDNSFSDNKFHGLDKNLVKEGYVVGVNEKLKSIRFMPPFILSKDEILGFKNCFENILFSLKD